MSEQHNRCVYAHLIANDFCLCIVFKMTITLESSFYERSELLLKVTKVINQMVNSQARAGGFRRVSRTNALLGCSDTGTTKLNLFQSVDYLMEVEYELSSVGQEESIIAVEAYSRKLQWQKVAAKY
jgi:hypothetical protein